MSDFDNTDEPGEIVDFLVSVNGYQLQQLITENQELKSDVIALVNVFQSFSGLFTGNSNMMSLIPVITKLLSNKSRLDEIANIVPIIEKYTPKTPETAENGQ